MRTRTVLIALIFVATLALLALVFIPWLLKSNQISTPTYWPTQSWRTSTPEEQGLDSAKLAEAMQAIQEKNIKIDGLLIIRNGAVVLDATVYPYDGTFPHDMASVTKSITTSLIGIAADQGKLQLDDPMLSFFPDRTIANLDARKKAITVRHLVGMVNGFESGCISGDMATLDAMRAKPDWVQATLDRKMVQEPGTKFCYDSPGMHLLSAILQKATGMTELEFARQVLFEPLGIHEVIWAADPQGYNHGWGDLHLKPGDAAKIGYLFLNSGNWEGKQIVSDAWVEDAVKAHIQAGGGESYGYGWWVEEGSYNASGRGGQKIVVVPSLSAIVVTVGGGFEYDEIDPYLTAAVIDPGKPLPANPQGMAQLNAALEALRQPSSPQPVGAQPDTSKAKTGKTYVFAPNRLDLESLTLDFADPAETILQIDTTSFEEFPPWPVGLDGKYRLSADGQAIRGYWADPQTFVFEIFDVGQITYRLHFDNDRLVLDSPDLGIRIEGQLENP